MPAIVQDEGIIQALRDAIEIMLEFKGISISLLPSKGMPTLKPGGGHDFQAPSPRDAQTLSLSKTNAFDGIEYSPNDDGLNRKRNYIMIGRHDAQVDIGDTWSDDEANYRVDTVDATSGFKTVVGVTGWIKVDV